MTEPVQLIVSQSPVSAFRVGPTKATQPHLAVVYATALKEVDCFEGRPMTPSQQVFSKYRTRYEVDMRDHQRRAELGNNPLVSRDQVHEFAVTVTFSFRVDGWEGAEKWVRGGLPDALPVVHAHIVRLFHGAGQKFDIDNSFGLEYHLNQLCDGPMPLPEGLLLHDCRASVRPDAKSREFLTALEEARRREQLGQADHVPNVGATMRELEIEAIRQQAGIAGRQREAASLADTPMTVEGLIRAYMIQNPNDREGAVAMLMRLREAETARLEAREGQARDLFQLMIDKKIVRPGDLNFVVDQVVNQLQGAPSPAPSLPGGGAGRPLPITGTPAPPWPASAPTPGPPAPGASVPTWAGPAATAPPAAPASRAFTGAALVYLVLDESLDPGSLDEVNRGLRALHDALSGSPEVSAALRLSVLGMAGDTQVRLEQETVVAGTRTPILMRRQGRSYEQAFRTLRALLPQDVAVVKAQRLAVLRPMVYFVSGGVPDEGGAWLDSYQELVDPARHPSAPHVVACGLGAAEAGAIRRIATQPAFGHVAGPNADAASAAHSCAGFLRDSVVDYGRRLAAGVTEFTIVGPDGFRPAADAL